MSGHPVLSSRAPPFPSTTSTTKPNSYDDQSIGGLEFGSQAAASAKIDNFYRVAAPQNILDKFRSSQGQYTNFHKVASRDNAFNNFGTGGVYSRLEDYTTTSESPAAMDSYENEAPLTGPMVVKVYPDGRPVRANVPLPQDEDLRLYKLSKVKLPIY